MDIIVKLLKAFGGMIWEIYWGLAFGFILSSLIRAYVSTKTISEKLGKNSVAAIAMSTLFGAVSSSCSYAAASMSRTLLIKGASWSNALVFMIASTNLVFEIFIVIITLLGWAFGAGELIGGIFFIIITAFIISKIFPVKKNVTDKKDEGGNDSGHHHEHDHHDHSAGMHGKKMSKLPMASMHFYMDVNMVGKDILVGVLIASVLMNFVPDSFWKMIFLNSKGTTLSLPVLAWNAFAGILIAIISFVCSVGNIVMAAVLWHGGISFGGVIAFILADLVTVPMLMVYRRYYGNKTMLKMLVILVIGIFLTALFLDYSFALLHWVPKTPQDGMKMDKDLFTWNRTTILNIIFIPISIGYYFLGRKNSM